VTIIPIDLAMDNGDGRTRLDDGLEFDEELSQYLGYSNITLRPGNYQVDYSHNDPFGRTVVSASLTR
ncbi:MAG: hypothetical protein ACK4L7_12145, partial [Flavobacteriales bacterium]